jgi:hypothetical protein
LRSADDGASSRRDTATSTERRDAVEVRRVMDGEEERVVEGGGVEKPRKRWVLERRGKDSSNEESVQGSSAYAEATELRRRTLGEREHDDGVDEHDECDITTLERQLRCRERSRIRVLGEHISVPAQRN